MQSGKTVSKDRGAGSGSRSGRMGRLCALLLSAVCCLWGLTACGEGDGTKVVFTTGFGKNEVFRIEDEVCTRPEIMVYLTTVQNQYENVYGAEIWNTTLDGVTLEENVKETVLARIAQIKSMYLLAKDRGVTLDADEEGKVRQAAEEYCGALNETEVERMGVSQSLVEGMYREYALADKVYRQIIQDINPEISDDEARTITVQHIFFSTTMKDGAGNRVDYPEAQKQAVYEKASGVRELAVDGEHDFAELATQYSEDTAITYSFGKGEMDAAFEEAAFNLETGEVSQVVETDSGYHIIKCLNTFDREETDANKLEIVEERRREVFGQEYDAFVSTLVRSLNEELWEDLTLIHDDQVTTSNFFEIYTKYFPS